LLPFCCVTAATRRGRGCWKRSGLRGGDPVWEELLAVVAGLERIWAVARPMEGGLDVFALVDVGEAVPRHEEEVVEVLGAWSLRLRRRQGRRGRVRHGEGPGGGGCKC